MATTTTKVKISGKVVEASNASLSPNTFKGYWADTNGIRIDKISFGSGVRFYIERWWAYNARLKIYIKSGVMEATIVEDTIDKLISGYFTKRELYYEMTLKKLSQYESLRGAKDFELCCDVVNGLSSFGEMRGVAKIKIENILWHDPVDNPQRTCFNSGSVYKLQNGGFGNVRLNSDGKQKAHQGLDIFAEINTPCYACLNGTIVRYSNEGNAGYGNVLVLKVKGDDLRKAERIYKLEFPNVEIIAGTGFNINADEFYLRYAHLSSAVITKGEVNMGDLICYSGDTGNAKGVPNPHLHFEVAMKPFGNGFGLQNRYNPASFVRLIPVNYQLQNSIKDKRKKR